MTLKWFQVVLRLDIIYIKCCVCCIKLNTETNKKNLVLKILSVLVCGI